MTHPLVEKIVHAVLYEGYLLYPYRPSIKNRQRWTFGGLFPRDFEGSDPHRMQSQCLVRGDDKTTIRVSVRFLHLAQRVVTQLRAPLAAWPTDTEPVMEPVDDLTVGGEAFHAWQDASEREISVDPVSLADVQRCPRREAFSVSPAREVEPLRERDGAFVGALIRESQEIRGTIEVSAERVDDGVFRATVRVVNDTPAARSTRVSRDDAQMRSMASTHIVLAVCGGEFFSLIDPPHECRAAAGECRNEGCWPVLVGEPGQRDTILCSPIILHDYPQIAPESPGDLFDATQIDEILTLRIMTLSDDEKRQVASLDARGRELLARTDTLPGEQFQKLHGAIRGLRRVQGETA